MSSKVAPSFVSSASENNLYPRNPFLLSPGPIRTKKFAKRPKSSGVTSKVGPIKFSSDLVKDSVLRPLLPTAPPNSAILAAFSASPK